MPQTGPSETAENSPTSGGYTAGGGDSANDGDLSTGPTTTSISAGGTHTFTVLIPTGWADGVRYQWDASGYGTVGTITVDAIQPDGTVTTVDQREQNGDPAGVWYSGTFNVLAVDEFQVTFENVSTSYSTDNLQLKEIQPHRLPTGPHTHPL